MDDDEQYFDDNDIGHLPADHVSLTHFFHSYAISL